MLNRLRVWALIGTLAACAGSPKKALDGLRVGMDKDDVLGAVGNPKRTFRAGERDHWVFVYFEDGREMRRQLDFAGGRLLVVGPPTARGNRDEELENAGTMEEFEDKVRARQRPAGAAGR